MAKTREYMDYLDETIGIAPAYSEEEYQASETIAGIMREHGIETFVEEFEGRGSSELMRGILVIVMFVTVVLAGILPDMMHVVLTLVALVVAALLVFMHFVRDPFEELGTARRSQNVVAVRRAQSPEAVRGSRPIVVVAHYDTPRESVLRRGALSRYHALLTRVAAICPAVVAVTLLFQVMVFLPDALRTFMWVVGIVAALPSLFVAVCTIMTRFGNCSLGSNDNKASVSALLSMVDKVSPADDRANAAIEDAPVRPRQRRVNEEPEVARPRRVKMVEEVHGTRHGEDVLRSLGMLPDTCVITYEEPRVTVMEEPTTDQGDQAEDVGMLEADGYGTDAYDENAYGDEADDGYEDQDQGVGDSDYEEDEAYDEAFEDEYEDADDGRHRSGLLERLRNLPILRGNRDLAEEGQDVIYDEDSAYDEYDYYAADEDYDQESYEDEEYADGPYEDEEYDAESEVEADEEATGGDEPYAYDDEDEYDYADEYEDEYMEGPTDELEDGYEYDEEYDEDLDEDYSDEGGKRRGASIGTWFSERFAAIRTSLSSGTGDGDEWIDEADIEDEEDDLEFEDRDALEQDEGDESGAYEEDSQEVVDGVPEYEQYAVEDEYDYPEYEYLEEDEYADDSEEYLGSSEEDGSSEPEKASRLRVIPSVSAEQYDPDAEADLAFEEELERDYASDFEYDDDYEYDVEDETSIPGRGPSVERHGMPVVEDYASDYDELDADEEEFLYDDEAYEDDLFEQDLYEDEADVDAPYDEEEMSDDGYADEDHADEDAADYGERDEDADRREGASVVSRILGLFRGGSRKDGRHDRYDEGDLIDDEDSYDEDYVEEEYYEGEDESQQFEGRRGGTYEATDDELYDDEYLEEYDEQYDDGLYDDELEVEGGEDPLPDPNELHFDREEDEDIAARDDSGLETISDSYDLYARDVQRESRRAKPAAIEDPTWGTATYQPARPAMNIARRAALYDLPDPSGATVDPLDESYEYEDDLPEAETPQEGTSSRGGFWHDDGGNARADAWKGGATLRDDLRSEEVSMFDGELQDAMLELGDEFLDEHDIWFVATGASGAGHAGIKAFLDAHRKEIRGAFLVNLECVGAGELAVYGREGLRNSRKADRRLVRMVLDVARDLHIRMDTANCDWSETDAASAMRSRVRSVSIVGLDDDNLPALSQTVDDVPENVNPDQVDDVVRIVTEVIRRA